MLYPYSEEERPVNPVPSGEHWRVFPRFRGHQLHQLCVEWIEQLVDEVTSPDHRRTTIDSKRDGAIFLRQLPSNFAGLFAREFPGIYDGALWGMALWNYLAEAHTHWYFVSQGEDEYGWDAKRYWLRTDIDFLPPLGM